MIRAWVETLIINVTLHCRQLTCIMCQLCLHLSCQSQVCSEQRRSRRHAGCTCKSKHWPILRTALNHFPFISFLILLHVPPTAILSIKRCLHSPTPTVSKFKRPWWRLVHPLVSPLPHPKAPSCLLSVRQSALCFLCLFFFCCCCQIPPDQRKRWHYRGRAEWVKRWDSASIRSYLLRRFDPKLNRLRRKRARREETTEARQDRVRCDNSR